MKNIFIVLAMLFLVLFSANAVFAISDDVAREIRGGADTIGNVGFGESSGEGELLSNRIGGIIKAALGLVGVIVVVIIVYAGFLWMTAGGNTDQVGKAKSWLINGVIGLVLVLSAYAITDFVISRLIEASA